MTEIKIEKKSPIWPWILLCLIIVAVLIYVFAFNDDDETDNRRDNRTEQKMEETQNTSQAASNNSAVTAYVHFIQKDNDSMGLDHEFTNEALSKLTEATTALANEIDYNIRRDIEELKTHTDQVNTDPFETTHANSIRKSADILSDVLKNIQQEAYSDLGSEADKVKNAAKAIKPETQTLNQKEDVKNFFNESANLLEKMNTNSPKI